MTNILIFIIAILVIATLVQIVRVSELLSEIKNKDVNEVTDKDNNTQGIIIFNSRFWIFNFCCLANDNLESSFITSCEFSTWDSN